MKCRSNRMVLDARPEYYNNKDKGRRDVLLATGGFCRVKGHEVLTLLWSNPSIKREESTCHATERRHYSEARQRLD